MNVAVPSAGSRDLEALFETDEFLLAREKDRKTLGGWHINTAVQFVRNAIASCRENLEQGAAIVGVINDVRSSLERHKYAFVLQGSYLIQWMNGYFDAVSFHGARQAGAEFHQDHITALAQSGSYSPRQRLDEIQRYLSKKPEDCSSDAIVTLFQQLIFILPPDARSNSLQKSLQKFLLSVLVLIQKNAVSFQKRQIFRMVHALRFLEPACVPDKVQDWLIEQAQSLKEKASYRDCVILLQGFYAFREQSAVGEFCDSIFSLLEKRNNTEIDNIETCSLKQLYSMYRKPVPEWLSKEYDHIRGFEQFPPSSLERKVYDSLEAAFPANNNVYFEHFFHESGYEMDIFFPELHLNIEIDGPVHFRFRNQLKDDQRDAVLTEHGITVLRLTGEDYESKIQAIVQQYKDHLVKKEHIYKVKASIDHLRDQLSQCTFPDNPTKEMETDYKKAQEMLERIYDAKDPIAELLRSRQMTKAWLKMGKCSETDFCWQTKEDLLKGSTLYDWVVTFMEETDPKILLGTATIDLLLDENDIRLLFINMIAEKLSQAMPQDKGKRGVNLKQAYIQFSYFIDILNENCKEKSIFESNIQRAIKRAQESARVLNPDIAFKKWCVFFIAEGLKFLQGDFSFLEQGSSTS